MKFAKLFDMEDGGQVLVTIQEDEEGQPEVRFRSSVAGFTVEVAPAFKHEDTQRAWDLAEQYFSAVDAAMAKSAREQMAITFGLMQLPEKTKETIQ